jgi:GDP-L-fucose synthase
LQKHSKVYIAGYETFIGTALSKELVKQGYTNVISKTDKLFDLTSYSSVNALFSELKPEYVFMVAGNSGGILANQRYPADLMINNLLIACHIIHHAYVHGVKKLLYLASSCSYPRDCPQPMKEEYLLTGSLEKTNEAYAVAKIAGIKLCQAYRQQYGMQFIVGIPANVYGPGDDFSEEDSHVIAALLRRMIEYRRAGIETCEIWGSGKARREFVYVDDLATACIFLMNCYDDIEPINIGSGQEVSITELAEITKEVTGYPGDILFDSSKPDGMPVKVLDSSKLSHLGWQPSTPVRSGIEKTYEWYLSEKSDPGN